MGSISESTKSSASAAQYPTLGPLQVKGRNFVDSKGRVALPRGVAFSGLSKVPRKPDGATHIGGRQFYDHREVSFVGRPCDLADLDDHFCRFRDWGFTLVRLLVTWEAVEHRGVGQYDEEYLEYLRKVCLRAQDYGLLVIIDPHQDCWSRWTGGDGAPGWTLEAANMIVGQQLHRTGASFLHQENGDPLPTMSWPGNYDRLACATMFSLFWAGDRLAPGVKAFGANEGKSVQGLLQTAYIDAMVTVATRLADIPSVLGFETMNEPHPGWIGRTDLNEVPAPPISAGTSPVEQLKSSSGPGGIWTDDECLWSKAGMWDQSTGEILDQSRFQCGDFMSECFGPFVRRYTRAIKEVMPNACVLVCPPAFGPESRQDFPGNLPEGCAWAPHFYDGVLLVGKTWNVAFGIEEPSPKEKLLGGLLPSPPFKPVVGLEERIKAYRRQIMWKSELGGSRSPVVLGEVGVPFDVGVGVADEAIEAHFRALEALLIPIAWWNYTPDNTNARGDGWNGEDLSIYCAEDGGGRAVRSFVRPHLLLCAGEPLSQSFDPSKGTYECTYKVGATSSESVLFIPRLHFQRATTSISFRDGDDVVWASDGEYLYYRSNQPGLVELKLSA